MSESRGESLDELVSDHSPAIWDRIASNLQYRRVRLWAAAVLVIGVVLTAQALWPDLRIFDPLRIRMPVWMVLLLWFGAMACEFVDSTLGMGYGTTLTPLLMLAGFDLAHIVPAVLLSECLTGIAAGLMHHRDGNVDFLRDRTARGTTILLLVLTALGVLAAVALAGRISKYWLNLVVAGIVLAIGIIILATARRQLRLRKVHLLILGAVAAFNKGISGGGYGPLVTSGQIVSGLSPKQAIGITSLAEGATCLVGVIAYVLAGKGIDWSLAFPLVVGALMSVPLATLAVRRLPEAKMRCGVGLVTCALGLMALIKLLGSV